MKKTLLRFISLVLCVLLLAGCSKPSDPTPPAQTPTDAQLNPEALFQTLVKNVKYETELENVGETATMYFPEMPAGTTLVLYMGNAFYADQVALITLAKAEDAETVKATLNEHLTKLKDQAQNYHPEEVNKIEKSIIWHQDTTMILCVTNDTQTVQKILSDPTNPDYTVPQGTTAGETEAPTEPSSKPEETKPTTPPETTAPTQPEDTTTPTEPEQPTEPAYEVPLDTFDTTMDMTAIHYYSDKITIRVGNRAFENHVYVERSVNNYVTLVNSLADQLGDDINFYHMLIPTAIGVVLPDESIAYYDNYVDQGESIEKVFAMVDDSAIKVNCFENLRSHRGEYLYFRTDYHWNGPAAYYAYESFCQAKGVIPYGLDQREEYVFEGFLGGLYQGNAKKDPVIGSEPDTVYAYGPACDVSMEFTDHDGNQHEWPVIVDVDGWASYSKYNCFAGGDNPLTVFTNNDVTDGSVAIVIKESFGNALMPFLVDHYQTVYEIDYRYWEGNLAEFAKEVGADDVILANNMSMLRNDMLIGFLSEVVN